MGTYQEVRQPTAGDLCSIKSSKQVSCTYGMDGSGLARSGLAGLEPVCGEVCVAVWQCARVVGTC